MGKLMNFFKDEEGATAVEYAVVLALIIAVCALGYKAVGVGAQNTLTAVDGHLLSTT
ncbi:MAG: Flp family type IVb pilin [Desulfobulbaceae bacterium]|nr:Flp family type IVb pilin [Desulfobulbaceae bacterium]